MTIGMKRQLVEEDAAPAQRTLLYTPTQRSAPHSFSKAASIRPIRQLPSRFKRQRIDAAGGDRKSAHFSQYRDPSLPIVSSGESTEDSDATILSDLDEDLHFKSPRAGTPDSGYMSVDEDIETLLPIDTSFVDPEFKPQVTFTDKGKAVDPRERPAQAKKRRYSISSQEENSGDEGDDEGAVGSSPKRPLKKKVKIVALGPSQSLQEITLGIENLPQRAPEPPLRGIPTLLAAAVDVTNHLSRTQAVQVELCVAQRTAKDYHPRVRGHWSQNSSTRRASPTSLLPVRECRKHFSSVRGRTAPARLVAGHIIRDVMDQVREDRTRRRIAMFAANQRCVALTTPPAAAAVVLPILAPIPRRARRNPFVALHARRTRSDRRRVDFDQHAVQQITAVPHSLPAPTISPSFAPMQPLSPEIPLLDLSQVEEMVEDVLEGVTPTAPPRSPSPALSDPPEYEGPPRLVIRPARRLRRILTPRVAEPPGYQQPDEWDSFFTGGGYGRQSPPPPPPFNAQTDIETVIPPRFDPAGVSQVVIVAPQPLSWNQMPGALQVLDHDQVVFHRHAPAQPSATAEDLDLPDLDVADVEAAGALLDHDEEEVSPVRPAQEAGILGLGIISRTRRWFGW